MKGYKRNFFLSGMIILLSVVLIINAFIDESEFQIADIVSFGSLLIFGVFLLLVNLNNFKKQDK